MGKWYDAALKQRESMDKAGTYLSDAQASTVPTIYPELKYNGTLVKAGTRIFWNGGLKRAAVDLWDVVDNNPVNAPTLWEDVMYKDGIRIIPTHITAGLAFSKGEQGWWGNLVYVSLVNDNVYTPEEYSPNWELVT